MRWLVVVVVAAALAVSACFYDWPPPPAASSDAGAPTDATLVGDAGAISFDCDGALVCDRFDDPQPLAQSWPDLHVQPGGDLRAAATPDAPSPPNALLAMRPAATTSSDAYVSRVIDTPAALTHVSIAFALKPEVLDDAGARACVGGIVFGDGTGQEHAIRVLVGNQSAILQDRTATTRAFPLSAVPPIGAWSQMQIVADVGGRLVVRMNGATVADETADPSMVATTSTRFFVGINFTEAPTGAVTVHVDDVRGDGS